MFWINKTFKFRLEKFYYYEILMLGLGTLTWEIYVPIYIYV